MGKKRKEIDVDTTLSPSNTTDYKWVLNEVLNIQSTYRTQEDMVEFLPLDEKDDRMEEWPLWPLGADGSVYNPLFIGKITFFMYEVIIFF